MFASRPAHNNQNKYKRKLWEKEKDFRVTTLLESTVWCSTKKPWAETESMIHSAGKKLIKPVPKDVTCTYYKNKPKTLKQKCLKDAQRTNRICGKPKISKYHIKKDRKP